MTSSIGAQTTPEITPPVRAAVTCSASVSRRGVPPVMTEVTAKRGGWAGGRVGHELQQARGRARGFDVPAAVSGNWRPLSTDMLMRLCGGGGRERSTEGGRGEAMWSEVR